MPVERHINPFGDGLDSPIALLVQLKTEAIFTNEKLKENTELLGRVADDVSELKIKIATTAARTDGQKETLFSGARIFNACVTIVTSVATTWCAFKALVH